MSIFRCPTSSSTSSPKKRDSERHAKEKKSATKNVLAATVSGLESSTTDERPIMIMSTSPSGGSTDSHASSTASSSSKSSASDSASARLCERLRRKSVAHYDIQSITASPTSATRLNELLNRRRNTTTGASAASAFAKHQLQLQRQCSNGAASGLKTNTSQSVRSKNSSVETSSVLDATVPVVTELDPGDPSRRNEVLDSCPFFRNEIGGESERLISLSCFTSPSAVANRTSTKYPLLPPRMIGSTSSSPVEHSASTIPHSPRQYSPSFYYPQQHSPPFSSQNYYTPSSNLNISKSHSSNSLPPSVTPFHCPNQQNIASSSANNSPSHHIIVATTTINNNKKSTSESVELAATQLTHSSHTSTCDITMTQARDPGLFYHRPQLSRGLAILESESDSSRWKLNSCPYRWGLPGHPIQSLDVKSSSCPTSPRFPIEFTDAQGVNYYRKYFYGKEHQNWIGIDEKIGPMAISILREKCHTSSRSRVVDEGGDFDRDRDKNQVSSSPDPHDVTNPVTKTKYQYRMVVRTTEMRALRCTIHEDNLVGLSIKQGSNSKDLHARELLEHIAPEINLSVLRLASPSAVDDILAIDEQVRSPTCKVGVLLCRPGQTREEEFYSNRDGSSHLSDFLTLIGEKVELKGFKKYRGGLDVRDGETGEHSVYGTYADYDIMFHISTLLPYTPNDKQQLLRKQHIGNDTVAVIFQEAGSTAFSPRTIRSNFQHVFIIVRLLNPDAPISGRRYQVGVTRHSTVPFFGPPIPPGGIFLHGKEFSDWLLAKIINADNATYRIDKLSSMTQRTRLESLKDLVAKYETSTTLSDASSSSSAGAKFVSLFSTRRKLRLSSSNSRDKAAKESSFKGDADIRGALVWDAIVEDFSQSRRPIPCLVAISLDTFVIVEQATQNIIFVTPNCSILGWTSNSESIKLFYHQGESVLIKSRDPELDDIAEMVTRLGNVSSGCETCELTLNKKAQGSFGLTIDASGLVSHVDPETYLAQPLLRPNSRIVEVCKLSLATMPHDSMLDLLARSNSITLWILPPKVSGSARVGCSLASMCPYIAFLNGRDSNWSPSSQSSPSSPVASSDCDNIALQATRYTKLVHISNSLHVYNLQRQ